MSQRPYRGRFAPSPTGLLHAGSLLAALASWLDAQAHGGRWLVRIEDHDGARCQPGADHAILGQLASCGLHPDEAPVWQSQRSTHYQTALDRLSATGWAYPCACTRKEISQALLAKGLAPERHAESVYPGRCRFGLGGRPARAWRLLSTAKLLAANEAADEAANDPSADLQMRWQDRRLGPQQQNLTQDVGDFVLRRADGFWAYQLAVVVDDADQGITHVVRGEDLADNTPRQIRLQALLGLPTPIYLHTPLLLGDNGEKLSKQNGAAPLDLSDPVASVRRAAASLGLPTLAGHSLADVLASAGAAWAAQYGPGAPGHHAP